MVDHPFPKAISEDAVRMVARLLLDSDGEDFAVAEIMLRNVPNERATAQNLIKLDKISRRSP